MLTNQYSMSNIKLQKAAVDECPLETTQIFRKTFTGNGKVLDLATYISRRVCDTVVKKVFMRTKDGKGAHISLQVAEYRCFVFTVRVRDITAALISAFFDRIVHHPAVKSRLVEEIDHFDKDGRLLNPMFAFMG
ncbi:MAG: hypothetical protein Q9216_001989 [Gyalolechia sp. 2 TL-2023]